MDAADKAVGRAKAVAGSFARTPVKLGKKLARLIRQRRELPLPQRESTIASPLEFLAAFMLGWYDHDADAIADLFVEDADFVTEVGLWWTSRHSLRRALRWWFDRFLGESSFEIEQITERPLGQDAAVLHLRWRIEGQLDPDGGPTDARRGVMSVVLARVPAGGWVATSAHLSDSAPAADSNVNRAGRVEAISYLRPLQP